MRFTSLLWKIPAVIVSAVVAIFSASQMGWSGAEIVINAPIMEKIENLVTGILSLVSMTFVVAPIFLIYKLGKHALWAVGPLVFYVGAIPGAWNGYMSDFDTTRAEVLKVGYANAFAIDHMTPRGRFLTCSDEQTRLTDDAESACDKYLTVKAGEIIPGSEHKCGFLVMFSCVYTAEDK